MNRFYFLALMGAAVAMPLSAQSKFDTGGRLVLEQIRTYQANPSADNRPDQAYLPFNFEEVSRAGARVGVFVTLTPGHSAADVEANGLEVIVDCDDMVLAEGSLDQIVALEKCDFVKALSFGEKRTAMLDKAREGVNMNSVHDGTGLVSGYKGQGVIAGIFDTGLDPNHANFCDANGDTRVGSLWHFTTSSGTSVKYDTPSRIASFKTDNSGETHGTHTTGCMAGSFNRRGGGAVALSTETSVAVAGSRYINPYYGMAPEATLAIGCGELYDPNITASVEEIIKYAESQGKPAVVNLSIGSTIGPHDGSDAVCQFLSRMGKRAIICIASGNEGDIPMSVTGNFTASNNSVQTFFYGANGSAGGIIDIWSNSATPFTTSIMIYDLDTKSVIYNRDIAGDTEQTLTFASSTTSGSVITSEQFDRAFTRSSISVATSKNAGTNNRYSVRLMPNLINNRTTNATGRYVFAIKLTGTAGQTVHMTTNSNTAEFTDLGQTGFADGSGSFSISSMACGDNVLVVGAWNTRKIVPCLGRNNTGGAFQYDGWGMEVDSIAGYSSWGVLADGRKLPHVCAPGTGIISSISTYYYDRAVASQPAYAYQVSAAQTYNNRKNYWEVMQGTSMATPIAAGAIATWLQADPTLTIDDVKALINEFAVKDRFVTGAPNPTQWGAGKFDAYGPIHKLLAGGVSDVAADRDNELIIDRTGTDTWSVALGSARTVNVNVYNMQGALVATAAGDGSAEVSTSGLARGIYIMSVNGTHSARVAVE